MSKARILVVEDEIIVQMDIRQRLVAMNYDVVGGAATGENAIRMTGELLPDLVLMDIELKDEMDGIQAAEVIRNKYGLPVIFLTAFADELTLRRARETEAYGYVLKPFEERELSINIEMALYKHRAEQRVRDNETWLRTIFNSALDGLFVVDLTGNCVYVNPSGCQMCGYSGSELISTAISPLLFPAIQEDVFQISVQPGEDESGLVERRMRRKDGAEIWVEMRIAPLKLSTEEFNLATMRDVTQRKRAEEALRESEERYMLAAQGANDGLWDWDLVTDTVYFSSRWKSILGHDDAEIGEHPGEWFNRVHPDDLEQLKVTLSAHLSGLSEHFEFEHRIQHKDGRYLWVLTRGMAVRDSQKMVYRIAGSQTDITNRKRAEEQLLHDAFHDALTNLPNRALFLDRLTQVLEHCNRNADYAFGVLFFDLDQFKVVNDSLGHNVGDELLIAIGKLLQSCVRSVDTVARLGGDEFVILLEEVDSLEATTNVADRIQQELKKPIRVGNHQIHSAASIGIIFSRQGYERTEDILRDADIAMYQAKARGKNRSVVFETHMRKQAIARLELENDLHQALERGEFELYYQSIQSLVSNQIVGLEALIRWRHPERGFIPPMEFIPVAEETRLIFPIGAWVLREACRRFQEWRKNLPEMEGRYISVNISGEQLIQPEFIDQVVNILAETGMEAGGLRLEVTEATLAGSNGRIMEALKKLRALGIQLYIDDFGVGFSSLSYIRTFPVSSIKIDRKFIEQMTSGDAGSHSVEMIESILKFSADLGMEAIAEGVETIQQYEQLKSLVCPYGQGFYLSKPLNFSATEALLLQSSQGN